MPAPTSANSIFEFPATEAVATFKVGFAGPESEPEHKRDIVDIRHLVPFLCRLGPLTGFLAELSFSVEIRPNLVKLHPHLSPKRHQHRTDLTPSTGIAKHSTNPGLDNPVEITQLHQTSPTDFVQARPRSQNSRRIRAKFELAKRRAHLPKFLTASQLLRRIRAKWCRSRNIIPPI